MMMMMKGGRSNSAFSVKLMEVSVLEIVERG